MDDWMGEKKHHDCLLGDLIVFLPEKIPIQGEQQGK
jgi:hypothetical protein